MNVLVAMLDYGRDTYSNMTLDHNKETAAYPYSFCIIREKGIARAINKAIEHSEHYDALFVMANDILMPMGWLQKAVEAASAIPHTGVAALYTVQSLYDPCHINDVKVYPGEIVFGNALYTKRCIEAIGHMNEDYDPYGMQDSDYCHRAWNAGFINYYVDVPISNHVGHDVGDGTLYRAMKDEGLAKCPDKWMKWTHKYKIEQDYKIFYDYYNYPKK
jgi:GT2 family glycosyltransferase